MNNGKIIVTGGMGYIGSHTVVELIQSGFETVIIDNLSNSEQSVLDGITSIVNNKVAFEKIDLQSEKDTDTIFMKHSDAIGVIHFAALKAVGESVQHPTNYYKNNLGSLLNVISASNNLKEKNLIFSSSCTVYGQPEMLPVTESSPFLPAESPYGATKQMSEQIIKDTCEAGKITAISLRYFNPLGAHHTAKIGELPIGVPNNLLPYITQTVAGIRERLSVFGSDYDTHDGTAMRDYIHVVDLSKAHVIACQRLLEKRNLDNYEFFNLGTGMGTTVLEVIESFERSTGKKVPYQIVDRRAGDIEKIYADCTKANNVLGWKAEKNIDDMTLSAWNWELKLKESGAARNQ